MRARWVHTDTQFFPKKQNGYPLKTFVKPIALAVYPYHYEYVHAFRNMAFMRVGCHEPLETYLNS